MYVVVVQRTAKKCTKNYNARAQPLYCSLNLLFVDVPVVVAVVVFLLPNMYQRFLFIFVTAVCVLFVIKLRWPKRKI